MGILGSFSFPSSLHFWSEGDCVKDMINEMMCFLRVRFYCNIRSGGGSKHVENGSHRFEVFVHDFIADSRCFFRLKNQVFIRTYV